MTRPLKCTVSVHFLFQCLTFYLICLSVPSRAQTLACQPSNGSSNFTVFDQADIDALAQTCSSGVRATIVVAESWQGPLDLSTISSIQNNGGLYAWNVPGLTSVSAPSLDNIEGSIYLYTCANLVNVSFPVLRVSARGFAAFSTPKLEKLDLSALNGSNTTAYGYFNLYDTALTSLDDVRFGSVGSLSIQKSSKLDRINLGSLRSVKQDLKVIDNGPDVTLVLPNLTDVNNIDLQNVARAEMQNVIDVAGTVALTNNSFGEFAMPKVRFIGDSLIIAGNPSLAGLVLPSLITIGSATRDQNGSLTVLDNPELVRFDSNATGVPDYKSYNTSGLSSLFKVYGDVNIRGPFSVVDLGQLGTVHGYFSVNSTNSSYSCNDFDRRVWKSDSLHTLTIESTNYTCRASAPGTTKDTASHCCRPMSTATKAGIGVGVALGVILLLSLSICCCFRERIRSRRALAKARRERTRQARHAHSDAAAQAATLKTAAERDSLGSHPAQGEVERERDFGPLPPSYDDIQPAPGPAPGYGPRSPSPVEVQYHLHRGKAENKFGEH